MKKESLSLLRNYFCLFLTVTTLLLSCSKDEDIDTGTKPGDNGNPPNAPTSILEQLENAYNNSLIIKNIANDNSSTIITFNDNSTISLTPECHVINAENEGMPTLSKSFTGTWMVNGIDLGIPSKESNTEETKIVCVTYNKDAATVYLNDGNRKVISREGEDGIYSFIFEAINNQELSQDIEATINDNMIEAILPEGVSAKALVASFNYRGESVTVNNAPQQSGTTINNFEEPLTFVLKTNDGSTKEYVVNIKFMCLPKIYIHTENNAEILDKENYVNSTVRIEDPSKIYTDGTPFESTAGIRGRGNSTWDMPKKPYKIKLDKAANLLGINSDDKDWALLANYSDKSLLRNIVAFKISEIVGMRWTPKSVSAEVYLNDKYLGVYTLTDHKEVSEKRLNLNLAEENGAVEGDYFMELDFHYDEGERFKTDLKQLPIMLKDPEEVSAEQFNFVKDFFNKAEAVLYSDKFTDPEEGYHKYIDINSFVDYFIVQELSKNCDGNMRGSCYLSIIDNKIIEQSFVWDFDIAFGNAKHIVTEQGASSDGPTGWYIKTCSPWFDQLFKDPKFVQAVKDKWNAVKPQLNMLPFFVTQHYNQLKAAAARNFGKIEDGGAGWNVHEIMWPNYVDRGEYKNEVDFLISFIQQRMAWLDKNINNL